MIALKLLRRLSRLEGDFGTLWKELETPMPHEMRYNFHLARLEKRWAAEREAAAIDKTSEAKS